MVDQELIESWETGLESEDGSMTMMDMISVVTERLGAAYGSHSSLEAATVVLQELTGWQALIVDRDGNRVAGSASSDHPHPQVLATIVSARPVEIDGWLCLQVPSTEHHVLCVEATDGMEDRVRVLVLEEIVALTAFERRLEESAMNERLRMWGDLAEELLSGIDRRRVVAHARALGHDLDRPHRVGLLADGRIGLSVEQVRAAVRRSNIDALVAPWDSSFAVVLDESSDPEKILDALDQVVPGGHPWMGVSSVKAEGHDLSEAVAEAAVALSFGRAARDSRTVDYSDLGIFRLFAPGGRWTQLEDFVTETLGPLLDYDAVHSTDLVHTLDAYLRRDGSLNHLAETLMIHRSTLVYRLRRIRELLDVDIDDSSLRLDLSLAARAVDVLRMTSGNPGWPQVDDIAS